jgi:uncharacterized membrane protein
MPYPVFSISLLLLVAISVIYALFDVFNNRNVPNWFAYAGVAIGLAVTVAANVGSAGGLEFSLAVAAFVGAAGYLVYKMGFWGAGDFFELVAVSLLLPVQPAPMLLAVNQIGLPFVLSVFIATGLAAIWFVPVYYLLIDRTDAIKSRTSKRRVAMGALMGLTYVALFLTVYLVYGFSLPRLAILLAVAIPSSIALVFEEKITSRMVRLIPPRELEEGDMIAVNLMSKKEVARLSKKYDGFGRLVTSKFIREVKGAKERLPVYRNAVPLALFILIGVIASLLFGNLILLML